MELLFLCIKIFIARLVDVSLGTFRTINTVKGKHFVASIIGFVEITVWFLIVKEVINTNDNSFWVVLSYSLGFSIGTLIGGKISNIFIKSDLEVQVILSKIDNAVINEIRKYGYAVTSIEVNSERSKKHMLFIEIKNKSFIELKNIIKSLDKNAFIVVNETKYVENGYFKLEK